MERGSSITVNMVRNDYNGNRGIARERCFIALRTPNQDGDKPEVQSQTQCSDVIRHSDPSRARHGLHGSADRSDQTKSLRRLKSRCAPKKCAAGLNKPFRERRFFRISHEITAVASLPTHPTLAHRGSKFGGSRFLREP